jgi:hypothetical protein
MSEDDLAAKGAAVEEDGKRRFGDHWNQAVAAIGRNIPAGVSASDVVREVLRRPDPAGLLFNAGREALIAEASEGNHDSEVTYSKIRAEEREAHLRARGRMR